MAPAPFDDIQELLHASLRDAVGELFAGYGLPIEEVPAAGPLIGAGESIASAIGYSHPTGSGALTVIGAAALMRALLVGIGVEEPTISDIQDAGGELNNMLLGRLNNKCARYGLQLKLGTPTTLYGRDLHLIQARAPSLTSTWTAYTAAGDRFYVRLDTLAAEGHTRQLQRFTPTAVSGAAAEGDALFFDD